MPQQAPMRGPFKGWRRLALWKQIFIALIAGLVVGVGLNMSGFPEVAVSIKPIGDLFIRGIKMLIVPLVFVSLVTGVSSLDNISTMGRLSIKTVALYLITTAVAIVIGLVLAVIFQPGSVVAMAASASTQVRESPPLIYIFLNLIPTNPFESSVDENILQIIVFAIFFGVSISLVGEKGRPVREFFESAAQVIYRLTAIVISFAPYGVFALIAWVAGSYGLELLAPLLKVILIVYVGCILHAIFVYGGLLKFLARLNPVRFFQGVTEPAIVAFTSTSSAGTLPVSIMATEKNLGVSRRISSFVLPLGATINMDGTALYQGVCAVFIAQVYGIELGFAQYLIIVLTATLGSLGTAGVPGAGLIMLSLVLTSVGLPLEGVAIIAGIDRILDMARTCVNVVGDCAVASIVAKSEGELDQQVYDTPHVLGTEAGADN